MHSAFIRETGAPSVIEYGELDRPVPGEGEVLVKVGAVAVNPIDTYIRSGAVAMPLRFPYIVGCDLAGTVEAAGRGCTRYKPGDRVWGSNQGLLGRQGTFAEYAAVHEQWLYPTPAGENDQQAAAGALVGITAHLGLFRCGTLKAGEIVFVNGGAGGVGSSVVQLAKHAGAIVIATAGSPDKQETCRRCGADLAIDYHAADMDDQIRRFVADRGGINVWYETLREPTLDRTISMMAPRGRIIAMAGRPARPEFPWGPFRVKDLSLVGFTMFNATAEEQRECGQDVNAAFENGAWKPLVGKVLPLAEAAAAHQLQQDALEGRATLTGKIVLVP